jgi:hypothetical protein
MVAANCFQTGDLRRGALRKLRLADHLLTKLPVKGRNRHAARSAADIPQIATCRNAAIGSSTAVSGPND